ncbi:MAG: hypothetical protein IJ333_04245, partial [Clostridia bacterium]|nr:hypothetical protein [Clostridia bacterium]
HHFIIKIADGGAAFISTGFRWAKESQRKGNVAEADGALTQEGYCWAAAENASDCHALHGVLSKGSNHG